MDANDPKAQVVNDASLGELAWDGRSYQCVGRLKVAGREVPLDLWLIRGAPGAEAFAELRTMWQGLPERLAAAEPALRAQTAERLVEALEDYGAESPPPPEELAGEPELRRVTLNNDGEAELRYACDSCFGAQPIRVTCDRELAFRDVEVG